MRILHIVGSLKLPRDPDHDQASGAVRVALETARQQVQLGHEVWVVGVGEDAWQTQWQGTVVKQLRLFPWAKVSLFGRTLDFRAHLPYVLLTRKCMFDVVQGYLYVYLRFLKAKMRVAVFQVDPFHLDREDQNVATKMNDLEIVARYSDAQVAASKFVADQLQKGPESLHNIHVVYNAVENERFNEQRWLDAARQLREQWQVRQDEVVFIYCGAVVPEKGVLPLARAFSRISERMPHVHLVIAGGAALWDQGIAEHNAERSYEAHVRAALDGAYARGKVHLLGVRGAAEMPALNAASDVVVVPSLWKEAFGLVALEGLASSRPVIASATGGLPELVNPTNGILVEPGDEDALEAAMTRLALDAELRRTLGQAGRLHALKFSWQDTARSLDRIYAAQLAGKG